MATISRMAINLAWDGQEAEAGLNKTAHLLKATGIAALDAANNFSKLMQDKVKSLGLSDSEIRSLSRLSELDKERALAKYEEEANYRKMSKNAQLLYEQMTAQAEEAAKAEAQVRAQQEARAKLLAGLNALEKEQLFAKEKEQKLLLSMSADQIRNYEAMKKAAVEQAENQKRLRSDYEARQKQLAGLTVLEKDQLFAKEKERALLLTMTGDQIKKYEADKAAAAKAKADAEARQKQLAGLSALDKQRLFDKEARQQKILGMTAKQQLAFEAQEKAAEKARAKAEAWADMSWIQKIKKSLQGAQDIKATIEMVRGLFRLLAAGPMAAGRGTVGILKLSAELETAKISMGVLVGGFAKGAEQVDRLRKLSVDMGIPLQDAADAFKALFVAGINAGDAEKLLNTFGAIAPLLGQGGLGQVAQGIAGMARSGMAAQSTLDQFAASGLPVYESLAEKLTTITGEFHTVRMAQEAVGRGAVLASTAISAMQSAAKSPQALEGAQKFAESLDGQILRLREGLTDIFRDIGDLIRQEIPVDNMLAGLRGAISAIADVVREMAKEFANMNGGGRDLEANFKNARNFMFDMMETVVKAMQEIVKAFRNMANEIKSLQATKKQFSWGNLFGLPGAGVEAFAAKEINKINQANVADDFGKDLLAIIKKMRDAAEAAADVADGFAAGDFGPPEVAGVNAHHMLPKDMPAEKMMRSRLDSFTELRDMQALAAQGKMFDAGAVSGKVTSFLERFGQKSDTQISQRIDAGSAAAAEAVMRNRAGFGEVNIGEAIKRAVEAAEREQKIQTDIEQKMLDAIKAQKFPATVQVPV